MDRADVTVDNTGSLAAFHERVRDLLGVTETDSTDGRPAVESSAADGDER
jgi:hypothetical protein